MLEKQNDNQGICRAIWTDKGKDRTLEMDETELINNQAGLRSGRKSQNEDILTPKLFETTPRKGIVW